MSYSKLQLFARPSSKRHELVSATTTIYQANGGLNFAAAGAGSQTVLTECKFQLLKMRRMHQLKTLGNAVILQLSQKLIIILMLSTPATPATLKLPPSQSVVASNTGTEAEQLAFLGWALVQLFSQCSETSPQKNFIVYKTEVSVTAHFNFYWWISLIETNFKKRIFWDSNNS